MNTATAVAERLAAIPGWKDRPARIVPLPGGFHHRVFRIDSGGNHYVLRLPQDGEPAQRERFALECRLQQQAAEHGLAPGVLHADPAQGVMLAEFVPGRAWTKRDLEDRNNLQRLAALLRRLHALPRCGVVFDAPAAAAAYVAQLPESLAASPTAQTCRQVLESMPEPGEYCLCHNDVIAENVIHGARLKLVDFEYACDNDPLFDLASVIGWHHLAAADSRWLLAAYADGSTPALLERLGLQRRLFDALQWLWLAAQPSRHAAAGRTGQMARVAARLG